MFYFVGKDEVADTIDARFLIRPQQVMSAGVVALLIVVGLEAAYVLSDPPEPIDADEYLFDLYELPITVATATYQQTFDLNDGESADFETNIGDWGIPEDAGVIYDIQFEILYSDTQENLGGSACDSVTTLPDFSGAAGPFEIVDDSQQTNEQCDAPVVVAYIYQLTPASIIDVPVVFNEDIDDFTEVLMDQSAVQGDWIISLSLSTNAGTPVVGNDGGEQIQVIVTASYVESIGKPIKYTGEPSTE